MPACRGSGGGPATLTGTFYQDVSPQPSQSPSSGRHPVGGTAPTHGWHEARKHSGQFSFCLFPLLRSKSAALGTVTSLCFGQFPSLCSLTLARPVLESVPPSMCLWQTFQSFSMTKNQSQKGIPFISSPETGSLILTSCPLFMTPNSSLKGN